MKKYYSIFLVSFFLILSTLSQGQDKKVIIKNYLLANFASLNLSPTDASQFTVTSYGTLKNPDYSIAYLQQEVAGVKIANTSATVVLKNDVVSSFKHAFIKDIAQIVSATAPSLSPTEAARQAISQLGLSNSEGVTVENYTNKEDVKPSELDNSNFVAPLTYFKNTSGTYVLAYELIVKTLDSHWWYTQINASDGKLLGQSDLVISCNFDLPVETDAIPLSKRNHKNHAHSYEKNKIFINFKKSDKNTVASKSNLAVADAADGSEYNAFPIGVETPNHGVRTFIENPASVFSQPEGSIIPSPKGWHILDTITEAKTFGNNVTAYEDKTGINNPLPGSFAEASVPGTLIFDYPIDYNTYPTEYTKAATVNLFVWNNYMHDIFYNYGFDETNGNFQTDDYDRFAGLDDPILINTYNNDAVRAEAQDGSGLNNANFATSNDGSAPRMQMFLWGASPFGEFLDVIEPSNPELVGSYYSARFPFAAIPREEDEPAVAALLVLVEDDATPYTGVNSGEPQGAGESLATDDGCTNYTAASAEAVKGNIAVIMRGACPFVEKITLAQKYGAIGVIIINNVADAGPVNGGGEEYVKIKTPAISVSLEVGQKLLDEMATKDVFGRLIDRGLKQNLINRDGDLDQGIIAHEYGHGISTRMVGGRVRFDCLLSLVREEQMGEGWSDFFGLITTAKTTDTAAQPRGIGTYVQFQGIDGPGIRPAPYSTDMDVNGYTYGDIDDDELSAPHGVGFVWCTILWDMYWAFIAQDGYDPDVYHGTGGNNMATQLVMDGLKLMNCDNVGFVEGRDAIIEADAILNDGANECLIRAVFARRGVGAFAIQGTGVARADQVPDDTVNPIGGPCENLSIFDNTKTLFSIYPNPVSSEVYIQTNRSAENAAVSIFDINGKQLVKTKMDLGFQSRLDTGNLAKGIYVITIKLEDGSSYSQKLIKE
jgi:extracellular elastinolytic metalloproteinase